MKDFVDFDTKNKPRPHVNSLVRLHNDFTLEDRIKAAEDAGWNGFQFPSEMLRGGDLLSDSGTTTLTVEQFAAMVTGDESYGSNWGYFQLLNTMADVFGIDLDEWEIFLFHQGRAAEHALFTQIGGEGLIVPSNNFFDTTRANAENNKIDARDLVDTRVKHDIAHPFKGNINLEKLAELLETETKNIPMVLSTITNNTGGGQPVSMENLRETKKLCDKYNIPFFLDACRFAENAWFVKTREEGYSDADISDIVREEFSYSDGFTISLKKDGLSNMGGLLAIKKTSPLMKKHPNMLENIRDHQILVEGHPTYGGLSGRDLMTLSVGLETVTRQDYLDGRIGQVHEFGRYLKELGIPVLEPFGGHAVYIDIDRFFEGTNIERKDFGGITVTALLLLKGVRLCELGAFAFGTFNPETGEEIFPEHNYIRCAIPRNKYEIQDLYYVADCVKGLYDQRHSLPKAIPVYGKDKTLRHFKARFELK